MGGWISTLFFLLQVGGWLGGWVGEQVVFEKKKDADWVGGWVGG